ncbi:MAG: Re/Si-specific NAD(P)(+) transhydrogenase subunit alpha [Bacteroidetes bacterium]|nr:MAG: Re/Si-specific NAD(P)(+) transhydrogenase subunit alpha [Bacteroidota bacterium]
MKIGILREPDHENRVALAPDEVATLLKLGIEQIMVEKGAGERAYFPDAVYEEKGAVIGERKTIQQGAELILSIHTPEDAFLKKLKPEQVVVAQMNPLSKLDWVEQLAKSGLTTFSLDLIPRTSRAQTMDVLSSMATAAGYKAILLAASELPSFFPMFMTAAGTIRPAKVLVLGAGVAGLQAISTARRLGAVVEAFDVRAAVKEEVQSLGAKFVEVEGARDDASAGGYAVEQTEEYKKKQAQAIHDHALDADVIICTAQIPGRRAPLLVHKATVEGMRPGSVIVDVAASTGGNCELTENDKTIVHGQVKIIGNSNLPATIPQDASRMFSKNVTNFLKLLIKDGKMDLNWEDDIVAGTCLTHQGEIVNERVKSLFAAA